MQTLTLHDKTTMPAFGLGTWNAPEEEIVPAVRRALEMGYRHIDCAAVYGNQPHIGRALESALAAGDVSRDDLWVTSKLWNNRHAPEDVRPALEQTLGDLRLDHLDLYLVHWPVALRHEATSAKSMEDFVDIPIEATWEAMAAVKEAGLTRQIGVSNHSPTKLRHLVATTGVVPAVDQVEMHPYLAQRELVEAAIELGVALTAYSPLGSPGSGKMFGRGEEQRIIEDPTVVRIGAARDATPAQILIAWALRRGTSVIPKSTNESRLRENLVATELELGDDDMAALDALDRRHRYIDGTFWCHENSPWTLERLWDEAP